MKFIARIIRAEEVPFVKKSGEQSSYYELQFVHGQRPKTIFNEQTGQEEPLYTAAGTPAMADDIMTIQLWGKSDVNYMRECKSYYNLVQGKEVEITLHSVSVTNQRGMVETKWLAPSFNPVQPQQTAVPQPGVQQPSQTPPLFGHQ